MIAKGVTNDALSRSVDASPRPLPCHPISEARGKGKLDAQRAKEGWRVRRKQVLSVPISRTPLMKILGRIVERAQWEVVTGLEILAFVVSSVIVSVLVAITVPRSLIRRKPAGYMFSDEKTRCAIPSLDPGSSSFPPYTVPCRSFHFSDDIHVLIRAYNPYCYYCTMASAVFRSCCQSPLYPVFAIACYHLHSLRLDSFHSSWCHSCTGLYLPLEFDNFPIIVEKP